MAKEPLPKPTLATLAARVEVLERPKPKTGLDWLTTYGTAVSLVVSLLTGGYTLWQNYVAEPRKAREAAFKDAQELTGKIGTILQTLDTKLPTLTDPDEIERAQLYAQMESRPLLALAEQAERKVRGELPSSNYVMLAAAEYRIGNFDTASAYSNRSVAVAAAGQPMAEALRNRGIVVSSLDRSAGQADFARAADMAEKARDGYEAIVVLTSWLEAEADAGNCSMVPDLLGRYARAAALPNLQPRVRAAYDLRVRKAAAALPQCRIDAARLPSP